MGIPFVFTNAHAYLDWAEFYDDLADLTHIDWQILQRRDFRRDADDPAKIERYQAEALIHRHLPVAGLDGIVCYTQDIQQQIEQNLEKRGLRLKVVVRRGWYF